MPANLPTLSAGGRAARASVGEVCLLRGLHLAMGDDKCLIGLGIPGMLYFSLESSNEVLEAVLMETHLCSCLPGRAVLF